MSQAPMSWQVAREPTRSNGASNEQGVSKVPGKQCVRAPAMSQAPCELALSQGANKEPAMRQAFR